MGFIFFEEVGGVVEIDENELLFEVDGFMVLCFVLGDLFIV